MPLLAEKHPSPDDVPYDGGMSAASAPDAEEPDPQAAQQLRTEVTASFLRLAQGEEEAREKLFELLYSDLKRLAATQLRHERSDHTLQPTALVHEVWMKLIDPKAETVESKRHFLLMASQAMRRLLVDHARTKKREKRGGDRKRVEFPDQLSSPDGERARLDLEAVHHALEQLEARSERYARIVELRFFCGLSQEEAAEALGISRATIAREWRLAKALLTQALKEDDDDAARPE